MSIASSSTPMMKAVVFREALAGPFMTPVRLQGVQFPNPNTYPLQLNISDWPRPVPNDGQVLIKVVCFGLNFADTLARRGLYEDAVRSIFHLVDNPSSSHAGQPPYPYIIGYECSGVIEAVGSKVTKRKVGDRVLAFSSFNAYAEYVVAEEMAAIPIPAGMGFPEAASIPVVFGTAYYCLTATGGARKGDRVLIHSAAGGVGLAVVQLAKHFGLEVVATVSSDSKADMLKKDWGVAHVVNYRTEDFHVATRRIYGAEKCVDIILDPNGGAQLKTEQTLLRAGGRLVTFGAANLMNERSLSNMWSLLTNVGSMMTTSSITYLRSSTSLCGVNMPVIGKERPELLIDGLIEVVELFRQGKLKSIVSKVYDWKDVGQAHADIESRNSTGKLILRVREDPN